MIGYYNNKFKEWIGGIYWNLIKFAIYNDQHFFGHYHCKKCGVAMWNFGRDEKYFPLTIKGDGLCAQCRNEGKTYDLN